MVRKVLVVVLMMCVACGTVVADVPQLLNYQGKLNDADGAPIEGEVTVGFGFYDAKVAGNPLYSEEQTVTCAKGVFHVLIGNGSNPQGKFSDIYAGGSAYMEITVDPQGAEPQVMAPRQRIGSVVFALRAGAVADHEERIAALEALLANLSRHDDTLMLTGMDFKIVNGMGYTDRTNGVGNLIVGYNEAEGVPERSGSHNIVAGWNNSYGSYGGFVTGDSNRLLGPCGSIIGGRGNTVSASGAAVTGGQVNTASGIDSTVSGGYSNTASSWTASVSGGRQNLANGDHSSVSGGQECRASGLSSTVSGGFKRGIADFDAHGWHGGGLWQDQ